VGLGRAAVALLVTWAAVIVAPAVAWSRPAFALEAGNAPVWGVLLALGVIVAVVRRDAHALLGARR
jgi:hypothetical protein